MLVINCKIVVSNPAGVEKLTFNEVSEVEIISSFRTLTDTAFFSMPRRVKVAGKYQLLDDTGIIAEGDRVQIWGGYDESNNLLFSGYVRRVGTSFPVRVDCENESYTLKKASVKAKEFKNAKLQSVLKYVLPEGVNFTADNVNLGHFIISAETTAAKVLEYICSQYSLFAFFRDGVLYCGLPFRADYQKEIQFKAGQNIINADGLRYVAAEDLQIKIKAISLTDDNKKLEVETGDTAGALRTFHYNNITDTKELKTKADEILKNLKYSGLHGSFETFGHPVARQGDAAALDFSGVEFVSGLTENDKRNGKYLIEKVTTKIGFPTGYRQLIELGKKL